MRIPEGQYCWVMIIFIVGLKHLLSSSILSTNLSLTWRPVSSYHHPYQPPEDLSSPVSPYHPPFFTWSPIFSSSILASICWTPSTSPTVCSSSRPSSLKSSWTVDIKQLFPDRDGWKESQSMAPPPHTSYLSRTPRTLSVENFLSCGEFQIRGNFRCGEILDVGILILRRGDILQVENF